MENKNKNYRIKIITLTILTILIGLEFCGIGYQLVKIYNEREELLALYEHSQQRKEKLATIPLANLAGVIISNGGGKLAAAGVKGGGAKLTSLRISSNQEIRTLQEAGTGALSRNNKGVVPVEITTSVNPSLIPPDTPVVKIKGQNFAVVTEEQAYNAIRKDSVQQLEKLGSGQQKEVLESGREVNRYVDETVLPPQIAKDGSVQQVATGSRTYADIAEATKIEVGKLDPVTGKFVPKREINLTPEANEARMNLVRQGGHDVDTRLIDKEDPLIMLNGQQISKDSFPEAARPFFRDNEILIGNDFFRSMGPVEEAPPVSVWRITRPDGTQTFIEGLETQRANDLLYLSQTTSSMPEKYAKFNHDIERQTETLRTFGFSEDAISKPTTDVYKNFLKNPENDPVALRQELDRLTSTKPDNPVSDYLQKELNQIKKTSELFPENTKTAESPFKQEFLEGATPISLGELGKDVYEGIFKNDTPEAREQMANIEPPTAEQMAGVGIPFTPEEIPAGMDFNQSLLGRVYNSVFQNDTPEAREKMATAPALTSEQELGVSTGEVAATNPALLNQTPLTWGQIANLGINAAFVWDPLLGIPAGEIAEIAIDGKRGPYDINSEAYKRLTPDAIGKIPTDPNHPLNSPEVRAIMEDQQAGVTVPEQKTSGSALSQWWKNNMPGWLGGEKTDQKPPEVSETSGQQQEKAKIAAAPEAAQQLQRDSSGREAGHPVDAGGCGGDRGEGVPVDTGGAREVNPYAGDRAATAGLDNDFWSNYYKFTPEAYEQAKTVAQNADVPPEAVAQQSSPVQMVTDDPGTFQNNPSPQPVPTTHVATSSPTPIAKYLESGSISGNGSDKVPFSIRSDTPEGRELIDKLYELDPQTGEISLKDNFRDTLKGLRGNVKLNDSDEVYDVKMEKGEITPEQRAEFILSDSGKTKVPEGAKVKDKDNKKTTASSDPQNDSQSPQEVDQKNDTVSTD